MTKMTLMKNRIIVILILISVLVAGFGSQYSRAQEGTPTGWLSGWANRVKLTIDHTKVDSALSDFPILVHLCNSSGENHDDVSFVFDNLGSDTNRKKIAITISDGTTECYVEIEKWDDANEQAWLWVKVPRISNTADTNLYLYYDADHADNDSMVGDNESTPAQDVWTNGFVMVQHLGEVGNGISNEYRDSTDYNYDGTGHTGTGTPTRTTGQIGNAQVFDGDDDYIQVADNDAFSIPTTGELTVEAWIRPDVLDFPKAEPSGNPAQGAYVNLLGKADYGGKEEYQFRIYNKTGSDRPNQLSFYVFNLDGGWGAGADSQDVLTAGQWIHVVGIVYANNVCFYKNSVLRETTSLTGYKLENGMAPFQIGHCENAAHPGYFLGAIDEVRVSNIARSDAWIRASYYSEIDRLFAFEVEEHEPTPAPTPGYIQGDANGDGIVNGLDLTKVKRVIMGFDNTTPGSDANSDGVENALDMTRIEQIILVD